MDEEEEEAGESESGGPFKCKCSQKLSSMKVRVNIEQACGYLSNFHTKIPPQFYQYIEPA